MKIEKVVLIRTVLLILALVNQGLTLYGYSPINAEATADFVAIVFTAVTAAWAWWSNNDVTRKARKRRQAIKEGRL